MAGIILGIVFGLIVTFIIYRLIQFRKESRRISALRFERVKPLYDKLESGEPISSNQLYNFAKDLRTRETTFQLLDGRNKADQFPSEFLSIEMSAESNLANWLEFPTELDAIPDEIEHVERVVIDFDSKNVIYHVFKFRVEEPHWAAENGWMLGVVGPYFDDSAPYDFPSSTFSRLSSKFGVVKPKDEAIWVHKNISMRR